MISYNCFSLYLHRINNELSQVSEPAKFGSLQKQIFLFFGYAYVNTCFFRGDYKFIQLCVDTQKPLADRTNKRAARWQPWFTLSGPCRYFNLYKMLTVPANRLSDTLFLLAVKTPTYACTVFPLNAVTSMV